MTAEIKPRRKSGIGEKPSEGSGFSRRRMA
jgi:hypothetical protein